MFQMNANLLQLLPYFIMSNYNLQSSIHMNFVESRAIFLLVCVHGMAIFLLMFVHVCPIVHNMVYIYKHSSETISRKII